MAAYTLGKKERLSSKILIERLFSGGSKSFPAFPLRVVYMPVEPSEQDAAASILISVPKKRFKRAVKRNLVKTSGARGLSEEQASVAGCAGIPGQKTGHCFYMAGQ